MIIHRYITHVLSRVADKPILNDFEGKVNPDIDKFLQSIIKKVSKDDLLRRAKFDNAKDCIVRECCESIIHNEETFIENSKEIAAYLFETMKLNSCIDSCDLVICLYTIKDQRRVAIIKLDYRSSYNHSIEFEDNKFNIQMKLNEEVISDTKKPKQCALVGVSSLNSEYDLEILDKDSEKVNISSKFISEFLEAYKIEDDSYKTKIFIASAKVHLANSWIKAGYVSDLIKCDRAMRVLEHIALNTSVIDIREIADEIFNSSEDEEIKYNFIDSFENNDISRFNVDKKVAEKMLNNRNIKTNTGIKISAKLDDLRNNLNFIIKENDKGSYDLVVKNVEFIEVN
ncbi:nucleoid-associated protein [Romboutsia timonensis]|uniref:nucleoid-associated protein n=1 Tax=Romboutsia timonensis TaxID=1776391 RepID=UPI002A839133|nr:nucleoid-associated protein [Romboutsia timonensis]MDY3960200.1 nucleoid-associated protein [Romboutsia timonensis]